MPRLTTRTAIALLLAVSLLLLGPGLLPGRVIADHGTEQVWPMGEPESPTPLPQANADTVRENLVYRQILRDSLGDGELPWWEPGMYAGTPFVAMSHTQALYPLTWLTSPLPAPAAHSWLLWLHVWLAGIGALAWLRAAGRSESAALIGALSFMLNGMFATRHGHPQYVAVAAWLPWMLFAVEGLFRAGSTRWFGAVGIAITTALMILAGHPSIYVFGSYFVGLYLLWRGWGSERKEAVRALGLFAAAYAIGVALASVQLLALLELAEFSSRAERSVGKLTRRLHHWIHAYRMLFPDLTGTMADGSYFAPRFTHYWAGTLYNGVAPLSLAALATLAGDRRVRWFSAIALGVLLLLFVPAVFQVAYHLPGFAFGRVDRASIAFFLALAWLCAAGFDTLHEDLHAHRKPLLGIGGAWILASLAAVPAALWLAGEMRVPEAWTPLHAVWAAGSGGLLAILTIGILLRRAHLGRGRLTLAVVLLLVVDLGPWWRDWAVVRDASTLFPATETTDFLRRPQPPHRMAKYIPEEVRGTGLWPMFPSNLPAAYGLEEVHGFGPLHLHNLDILLSEVEKGRTINPWHVLPFTHPEALQSPVLDLLNVRYIVARDRLDGLPVVHEGELVVHENSDVLPRAWFVSQATDGTYWRKTAAELAAGVLDPRTTVALDPAPRGPSTPTSATGEVEILALSRNGMTLEKRGPAAGYVVISETWYPGWQARVDGVEAEVYRANVVQRAVAVPEGSHTISLAYVPTFLRPGLALTAAGLVGLLALLVSGIHAYRRERTTRGS